MDHGSSQNFVSVFFTMFFNGTHESARVGDCGRKMIGWGGRGRNLKRGTKYIYYTLLTTCTYVC